MASPFFSGRIPQSLYDAIESYRQQTGESKTDVLTKALAAYINLPLEEKLLSKIESVPELKSLEKRVALLEQAFTNLQKQESVALETINNIPPGQMSFSDIQISEGFPEGFRNSSRLDNKVDNGDNTSVGSDAQILTHRQVAEETGMEFNTIKGRHLRKAALTKNGVCYTPIGKQGKPRWSAKRID